VPGFPPLALVVTPPLVVSEPPDATEPPVPEPSLGGSPLLDSLHAATRPSATPPEIQSHLMRATLAQIRCSRRLTHR
jgi:hypothetical protein